MWRRRFLIDIWAEPRDVEGLPVIIRARVRDVATDVEHIIAARLDADGIAPRRWERP